MLENVKLVVVLLKFTLFIVWEGCMDSAERTLFFSSLSNVLWKCVLILLIVELFRWDCQSSQETGRTCFGGSQFCS